MKNLVELYDSPGPYFGAPTARPNSYLCPSLLRSASSKRRLVHTECGLCCRPSSFWPRRTPRARSRSILFAFGIRVWSCPKSSTLSRRTCRTSAWTYKSTRAALPAPTCNSFQASRSAASTHSLDLTPPLSIPGEWGPVVLPLVPGRGWGVVLGVGSAVKGVVLGQRVLASLGNGLDAEAEDDGADHPRLDDLTIGAATHRLRVPAVTVACPRRCQRRQRRACWRRRRVGRAPPSPLQRARRWRCRRRHRRHLCRAARTLARARRVPSR